MTAQPYLTKTKGNVLVLTINSPKTRNSVGIEFFDGATQVISQALNDETVGAIVLTGAEGFFCSGGDLNYIGQNLDAPASERAELVEKLNLLITTMQESTKPIITAVEGGAAGAGLTLALAGHMLISSNTAFYSAAYVRAGLTPDGGLTKLMSQAMPPQLMNYMVLTGERIQSERLYNVGVITQMTEPGEAEAVAVELGQQLAGGAQRAQARILDLTAKAPENTLAAQLEAETQYMVQSQADPEGAEGISAVLERRTPNFR